MKYSEQLALCMEGNRDFTRVDYTDPENLLNPRRAMRMKCMDCCQGDRKVAAECVVTSCAIYPYRAGRNPRPKRVLTEEQVAAARERARSALRRRQGIEDSSAEASGRVEVPVPAPTGAEPRKMRGRRSKAG